MVLKGVAKRYHEEADINGFESLLVFVGEGCLVGMVLKCSLMERLEFLDKIILFGEGKEFIDVDYGIFWVFTG